MTFKWHTGDGKQTMHLVHKTTKSRTNAVFSYALSSESVKKNQINLGMTHWFWAVTELPSDSFVVIFF